MKFATIALALTSVLAYTVKGEEAEPQEPVVVAAKGGESAPEPESANPDFKPTSEKPYDFKVEYYIDGLQSEPSSEIVPVANGDEIQFTYMFFNNETEEVSVVGIGGQLLDPVSGEVVANVTATQLGPITVATGNNATFGQRMDISLTPDKTYLYVPSIYAFYKQKFMQLGARNQLLAVSDPVISFFNPKLILSEITLLLSLAGVLYFIYNAGGKKYVEKIVPASSAPKTAAKPVSSTSGAEWLPDTHRRTTRKKTN